jgi:uncharacterized DUF497 family protein
VARFLFDWDEANIEHIRRHRYTPEDVEEVFEGQFKVRRSRDGYYVALGSTVAGRLAYVVFQRLPGRVIRTVTARDMDDRERRMFRRK